MLLRAMWFWWVLVIVLGLIPIAFWTIWALLKILALMGDKAEDVLTWFEQRW